LIVQSAAAEYVVVGAGPAGLTIARLLAFKGRKVIVADAGVPATNRLELLAPSSLRIVAAVGIESLLHDPAVAQPCLGIRRKRGSSDYEYEDFLRHPYGVGYVVNRARFDERLQRDAAAAGVEFCRARVIGIAPTGDGLRVQPTEAHPSLLPHTGTVIDATGRAAMIARRKGARVTAHDRMIAELIEETFEHSAANSTPWLDYRNDGLNWSYRIRGPGGHAQTWRMRRSGKAEGRECLRVDASARRLSEVAGQNWIAVGDAAISFDPITSQGLFNALSSALVVAGMLMSEGLNFAAVRSYSDVVAATFMYSEINRSGVYNSAHLNRT
jgi:flavin-dependent dehydrogenase